MRNAFCGSGSRHAEERVCKCGAALQHALVTDMNLVPGVTKRRLAAILEKYI